MKVPAQILAQANPLARAALQQMTGSATSAATASLSPRNGGRQSHTAKELAEAAERGKARMRKILGEDQPTGEPASSGKVDLVASMRKHLRSQGITPADEA